jgi:Subtilase family
MALIATGTAAVTVGVSGVPAAHADQIRSKEWWLRTLEVTAAWTSSQGTGVTVAVLSDGVQASDADLPGAITAAPAPSGAPQASGQFFGEAGTPIASLIAGRGGSGIKGIAPAAKILSIPVTLPAGDPELSQSSVAAAIPNAIAAGIREAVRDGATVIDLPIDPGQPDSSGTPGASAAAGGSPAEKKAVSYALAHNVVLVAPAGDDGAASDAANYPAAYPGVIAVGAFNRDFVKAPWTSHDSYVTVTAPGEGVLAATNSGGFLRVNSTSAASAIVAGIAALIRARYPRLSADQVRTAITTGTVFKRKGGQSDGSGFGAVNADKAVEAAAVLATPKGSSAGAGAQPLVSPSAIAAASATQGLGSQVLRDGEISAGLLAVLLLLIIGYAATGRRRRTVSSALVTAEWAHRQGQSRYPQAAAADADRMLEIFATPASEPERAGLASAWRGGGSIASRAGDGLFAPTAAAPAESAALLSHGPATRAVTRRPVVSGAPPWEATAAPSVSGTPPWEPASAPNSDLPWTDNAGRHSGQESWPPDEPAGQSQFGPGGQPVGQRDPYSASQPGWRPAESQAPPGWDSPYAGAGSAQGGLPGRNPAQHSSDGWDDGRWNPAPAAGPVIEGSVLDSGPADHGRASSASYPDPYSPSGQYSGSGQYSQPGQYGRSDPDMQSDWRGRHTWDENQAQDMALGQPGQDWTGPQDPQQPRIAPSGLPIRTPRPAASAPGPRSPSGSLWERAESGPGGYQDPSGQNTSQEPGSRPIYVWKPADRPPAARGYPPADE